MFLVLQRLFKLIYKYIIEGRRVKKKNKMKNKNQLQLENKRGK